MVVHQGKFIFPPDYRLRRRSDFFRVNKMGRKIHTPHFLVFRLQGTAVVTKLGITVSRKVGNAVHRNRTKRLVREFFRLHHPFFFPGSEISVIAKQGASHLSYGDIAQELAVLLEKPGK